MSSCHVMNLLCNAIVLPSIHSVSAKRKYTVSSLSLSRTLIILLLIISGNVHVNPGPPVTASLPTGPQYDLCFTDFCDRNGLGFLHINARSLLKHFDQIKVWVESSSPEILVLTETWLRKSVPSSNINISGYNLFRQDRSTRGGGVAIYFKDHLHCSLLLAKSIPKQYDLLVTQLKLSNNFSLTVIGCYRPPKAPACTLEALSSDLAPFTNSELVLLGDLNWNMLDPPDNVLQQFDSFNLHQIIAHPTRYDPKSQEKYTLIDVILTNAPHMYQSGVFCRDISDHCNIACIRKNITVKQPITISHKRSLKHFDPQAFLHDLATLNWSRIGLCPTVDEAWSLFKHQFSEAVNRHAPFRKHRLKNRLSAWMSHDLTSLLRHKNTVWRKALYSKTPEDLLLFRQTRNKATQAVRQAKSNYFQTQFTQSNSDPNAFWKTVRKLENKPSSLPLSLKVDGLVIADKAAMADTFNSHFVNSGVTHDTPIAPTASPSAASNPSWSPGVQPPPQLNFSFRPLTEGEVFKELTALDPKKSAGSDELPARFLKVAAPIIATPITDIFNLSLHTAEIPSDWKEAIVLPLFKGGEQTNPNSYRPISILPCVSKILEKLVNKQLTGYLNVAGILSDVQSGFRPGYGCTTATLKVLNDITSALDAKQHCAAVFIDLAKAFDSVNHTLLINRLSSIGVTTHSLAWFSHYLSHRVQRVRFLNLLSHPLPVTTGVPQGSILGPSLFSIFINDIPLATGNSLIHLYADDTILYASAPSPDAVQTTLQDSFLQVQHAFSRLNLSLNTSKTKAMKITGPLLGKKSLKDQSDTPLNIHTCEGAILEQVSSYKYLGIWIDSTLSFSHHISHLQSKVRAKLGFLYRNRHAFTPSAKLTLVKMTILPTLDFGDTIYRLAGKDTLSKLNTLYHSAIRFITNAPRNTHHCELYSLVGWPSLSVRRQTHWLTFIYKTLLHRVPPYLSRLLHHPPVTYNTRSSLHIRLTVPKTRSTIGADVSFHKAAAIDWNTLQDTLKLGKFISIPLFKQTISPHLAEPCNCF